MRAGSSRARDVVGRGMALIAATIVVIVAGCTSGVRSPLDHEITKRVTPEKPEFDIDGWTDRTGAHHKLHGRARIVGDSIQLYERHYGTWGDQNPTAKLVASVPRSDVIQVDVRKFSAVKTGFLFLTPVVAFYALLIIAYGSENGN